MKIAIPVSAHDRHLVPALTDCLLKFGGLEEHPVIFFPTPSAKDTAYEAAERLGAQTQVLEQDFEGGAPVACNNHFASVVYGLAALGNTDPFLWMEADMLPRVPRWADKLLDDYRMRGTPFMGSVVDTPFEENGKLAYREGDTMMMGCGVYPANMETDERIKPLILDLAKPAWMNPRMPFDIYLRWVIKNIGVSNTPLIADMWATENYQRQGHSLVCQSVDHGDRVVRKRGGIVNPQAVLVHGCKDGSLAKVIMAWDEKPINMLAREFLDVWEDTPVSPKAESPSTAFAADDTLWDDDDDKAPAEPPAPETVIPVTAPKPKAHTVTKALAPETPAAPKITRADIEKALGGKKMRVNDLAAKLKVEVPDLIGTFSTNGYIVAAAGWVQSTITITTD